MARRKKLMMMVRSQEDEQSSHDSRLAALHALNTSLEKPTPSLASPRWQKRREPPTVLLAHSMLERAFELARSPRGGSRVFAGVSTVAERSLSHHVRESSSSPRPLLLRKLLRLRTALLPSPRVRSPRPQPRCAQRSERSRFRRGFDKARGECVACGQ